MALTKANRAAEVMEHIIAHDAAHGYSQPNRAGDGTIETIRLSDGSTTTIHGGDYDCSELVRMCYVAAGVLPRGSYMWTGNEESLLLQHGFRRVTVAAASKMRRGDVLLRSGHTEMYLGGGQQGGARGDERGGITGPKKGDQTGAEIAKSAYTPSRWTKAFRYDKDASTSSSTSSTTDISKIPLATLVADTLAGKYGNGAERIKKLGSRYAEVQRAINTGTAGAATPQASSSKVAAGTYQVQTATLNVRTAPNLGGGIVATYSKGQTVNLDGWSATANGYVWGRYTSYSGATRYVALGPTSASRAYLKKI